MKQLSYLLLVVLTPLLSACEIEPKAINAEELVGYWVFDAGSIQTEFPNMDYTYPDFRPGNKVVSPKIVATGKNPNTGLDTSFAEVAHLIFFADGRFKGHNSAYPLAGRYDFWPDYSIDLQIQSTGYQPEMESEWAARFDLLLENMAEVQVNGDRLVLKDAFRKHELIFRQVAD